MEENNVSGKSPIITSFSHVEMSTRIVAPQVVSSFVTLQLNTKVGPFRAGSVLVLTPSYARYLVDAVPECVSLSTPIVAGAYVVVNASNGCYPYYNPYQGY